MSRKIFPYTSILFLAFVSPAMTSAHEPNARATVVAEVCSRDRHQHQFTRGPVAKGVQRTRKPLEFELETTQPKELAAQPLLGPFERLQRDSQLALSLTQMVAPN